MNGRAELGVCLAKLFIFGPTAWSACGFGKCESAEEQNVRCVESLTDKLVPHGHGIERILPGVLVHCVSVLDTEFC